MRKMLLVVPVALVALMSGTTLATAQEQSVEDKAVAPPEERAAPKKSVRVRVCEIYETDATGQRGRCLKYKPVTRRRRRVRAPRRPRVDARPCEKYETDATGQRGKCLKYKPITRRLIAPRYRRVWQAPTLRPRLAGRAEGALSLPSAIMSLSRASTCLSILATQP